MHQERLGIPWARLGCCHRPRRGRQHVRRSVSASWHVGATTRADRTTGILRNTFIASPANRNAWGVSATGRSIFLSRGTARLRQASAFRSTYGRHRCRCGSQCVGAIAKAHSWTQRPRKGEELLGPSLSSRVCSSCTIYSSVNAKNCKYGHFGQRSLRRSWRSISIV